VENPPVAACWRASIALRFISLGWRLRCELWNVGDSKNYELNACPILILLLVTTT